MFDKRSQNGDLFLFTIAHAFYCRKKDYNVSRIKYVIGSVYFEIYSEGRKIAKISLTETNEVSHREPSKMILETESHNPDFEILTF